jgi:hypothetical protein
VQLALSSIKAKPATAAKATAKMRHGSGSIKIPDINRVKPMEMCLVSSYKKRLAALRKSVLAE